MQFMGFKMGLARTIEMGFKDFVARNLRVGFVFNVARMKAMGFSTHMAGFYFRFGVFQEHDGLSKRWL